MEWVPLPGLLSLPISKLAEYYPLTRRDPGKLKLIKGTWESRAWLRVTECSRCLGEASLAIRKQFCVISISDKLLNEISEGGESESPSLQ